MSITLLCIVKGNTLANAFPVHIDKNSLVGDLKDVIKAKKAPEFDNFPADKLKLWKVEIPDDHDDQLRNLSLHDNDELLATKKISKYFTASPPEEHIHVIVKSPRKLNATGTTGEYRSFFEDKNSTRFSFSVLSLEEALSCVPPPVTYS
ncbi:hypothetical protein RhiirA4_509890 [Rhizophagus irregularis]|uniref:Crinkler effector protein N-terminal domain-containing protein n=1 Tax=Rhizophagus irregularis TaxID=588596 RepID=A0A2I1HEU4_9GLOM|nr:hypothetical protein RhiirA4_509890 [Rhizophagus irregularis]